MKRAIKIPTIHVSGVELCQHCLQSHTIEVMRFCAACDGYVCVYCIVAREKESICPECVIEEDLP